MSQAEQDLAYIQDVVREAEGGDAAPRSIYFLWGVIYFVGFSLYDYDPARVGLFWSIAGPGGGALSYWLGYRWSKKNGMQSSRTALRHLWHWLGMIVTIFLTLPLFATGAISADTLGKLILLIAAFGLFTAGIYLVRPYLWIGLALAACYVIALTVSNLPWLVVGALSGGAMVLAGLFGHRRTA